jgi:hypothetical protein
MLPSNLKLGFRLAVDMIREAGTADAIWGGNGGGGGGMSV